MCVCMHTKKYIHFKKCTATPRILSPAPEFVVKIPGVVAVLYWCPVPASV